MDNGCAHNILAYIWQAQRLLTYLSGEFDHDSACSEDASNTDSGRDTLCDDVETRKGMPIQCIVQNEFVYQRCVGHGYTHQIIDKWTNVSLTSAISPTLASVKQFKDTKIWGLLFSCTDCFSVPADFPDQQVPCSGTSFGQPQSSEATYPTPHGSISYSQFLPQFPQQPDFLSQPKQTLRDVKAKDRNKKSQFWSGVAYEPKTAKVTSVAARDSPAAKGLSYNVETGLINQSAPLMPNCNFNDASSMLNYKLAVNRQTTSSSSVGDITDDAMSATSTTSGSYVINIEDSMLDVKDVTV